LKCKCKIYWDNIELTDKSNGKIDKSEAIEIIIFSDELTKEIAKSI
jgi:hypothetical protein